MISRSEFERRFPGGKCTYDDLIALIKEFELVRVKLYPHRMDLGKVKVLEQIAKMNLKHQWVKVQQDSALIKPLERDFTIQTDAVHASRLVWFGLLDRKKRRSGFYRANSWGIGFLKGKVAVPRKIYVHKGSVYRKSIDKVLVHDVKHVILDKEYWDQYAKTEGLGLF